MGGHEGNEGYEGKEREEFAKGRHCRCTRNGNRSQEVRVFQSAGCTGGSGIERVKKGKFTIPGLVMIKTKKKAATKAGTKLIFGKMQKVKAKPAKTVVKAYCVKALKDSI